MDTLDSNGLERVFLRLLNCDTDDGLQDLLKRFLVPVLTALQDSSLVTKVNELLGHVNKRLQHRTAIQLPFYSLVELVKRDDIASFTKNMGVLYTKKAYERLELKERLANVDLIFSSLANKTDFQCDVLLSVLLPTLSQLKIPNYPEKQEKIIPSVKEPAIASKIFSFALKVVLLPYITVEGSEKWKEQPALSEDKISGILKHVPSLTQAELEGAKSTLVNIISCEIYSHHQPLVAGLLAVAGADTRCSVSDAADGRLKKLRATLNWEDDSVVVLLYGLFLGHDKLPNKIRHLSHGSKAGSLRLKMKILPVLSLSSFAANLFPLNIQVVFGGLFGGDANRQLNLSAVQFVHKICEDGTDAVLNTIGPMLKQGLMKSVQSANNADLKLCGRVYLGLGKLSTRTPALFSADVYLLSLLFSMLDQENMELIANLKEGLFLMTGAYKLVLGTSDEQILEDLLLKYINKSESTGCCVALRFSNILHPTSHLPSRYLCLLSLGSSSIDVVEEARQGLQGSETDALPEFSAAVKYIGTCTKERLNNPSLCYVMGSQRLPYIPLVFVEVLKFVRKCLEVGIPEHVVLESEKYRHLRTILLAQEGEVIVHYKELIMSALVSAASGELHSNAMQHLSQLSAALPETLSLTLDWCLPYLLGPLPLLRYHTATLLGLAARRTEQGEIDSWAGQIIKYLDNKQGKYEERDGCILAAGFIAPCSSPELASQLIHKALQFFSTDHVRGVCTAIYTCASSLALETVLGSETLLKLHQQLITAISQSKEQKLLISLITALGALHIHDTTLRLDQTLNTILNTSKLNLLELNFSTGKTLALISSGPGSKITIPDVYVNLIETTDETETQATKDILEKIIREYVLGDVRDCELQASSIWLLSLLKYSTDRNSIKSYKSDIQHALSVLLSSKDSVTQEIASEALALLYSTADDSTKSHLIDMLKFSLLNETVPHKHVAMETKIFSTDDLVKLPSGMGGGNLTTYKELCSLASDMNQPEMIYQFMHLSNNSSIWSDRVGAAFGVGHLMKTAGKELEPYLANIIPRVYRYQYDPNLKVQQSMSNIWSMIVPKPKETVDKYLVEIISDLKKNIHHRMWRTRESCSNALGDLVRTRAHDDTVLQEMPELWLLVLKIMDDIKESVRLSATKTAEILSRTSVSVCNVEHGARGARAISTILPVLLEHGITSRLVEIQTTAILTVMKISDNSGTLLSPHVHIIVPAFIAASATIEPKIFGQVTTMLSGNNEDKDKLEQSRAQLALTSPLVKVIEKCVRCVDDTQLEVLVAKLASLAKSSVGLTPRVTLLQTVSLLAVYKQHTLTPYVGKLMGAMFVVLTDRSVAVRQQCAATVAVLIRYAKGSTVDNVMEKLRSWYLDKEDEMRYLVSQLIYKMANTATDTLRSVYSAVIPLALYGKHSVQEQEKEQWELVWLELGISDQSSILTYLTEISELCVTSLQSTSWTNRQQGALALDTVARVLGASYPSKDLAANARVLMDASSGRVYPGKSAILASLSTTVSQGTDPGVDMDQVIQVFLRECRKSDEKYVSDVMRAFSDLIAAVPVADCWTEVWQLCQSHLLPKKAEEEEEETEEKKQGTFMVESAVQESAILLVGVSWSVCSRKSEDILYTSSFLAGIVKISTWRIQTVLLCAIQKILDTLDTVCHDLIMATDDNSDVTNTMPTDANTDVTMTTNANTDVDMTTRDNTDVTMAPVDLRTRVYESVIPGVLRCVDDSKHVSVRGIALKVIGVIFNRLKLCKSENLEVGSLNREVLSEVLVHVRDQISMESNHNLKAQGIEIVSMIEKEFMFV